MTRDEIRDLVSPSAAEKAPLLQWLADGGVTNVEDFGDSLRVTMPVSIAEPLLSTTFHEFVNTNTSARLIRAMGSAVVPAAFDSFVRMVTGLSQWPIAHLGVKTTAKDFGIVPQTVNALYKFTLPSKPGNVSQGIPRYPQHTQ